MQLRTFSIVNNMEGFFKGYKEKADAKGKRRVDWVLEDFNIRTVPTAHPTQFYPGSVLGIINDLNRCY
jgi:phosphoenolpyruvate carboxylase